MTIQPFAVMRRLVRATSGLLLLTLVGALPRAAHAAFGVVSSGGYYVADTGAGLVFKVNQSNGDINSIRYNGGPELQDQSKGTHIASGLGATSVTAQTYGSNYIKITASTSTISHFYMVRNGFNNIYLATYATAESSVGELRFIARLNAAQIPNGPAPSDLDGNSGAIESQDVFGLPNGQTRSKYFGRHRAIDLTFIGATGTGIGAWMNFGNREGSSGGPFYRDIENQQGGDQEIYNYMNSGHQQTEAYRLGGLQGPYALMFTSGAAPSPSVDYSWIATLGLPGYVGASGRGTVSGQASGVPAGFQGVVGFANATAQYWTFVNGGSYNSPAMIAGTYTQTLYKGELEVATQSVTVTAGTATTQNIASHELKPTVLWRIGEWDGTPGGFLNADKIIDMHPSDVRMSPWAPGPYTIGASTPAGFPAYQWKDVNNGQVVNFNLTAAQKSNLTLRIGLTAAYAGARPQITLNAYNSSNPSPSSQPDSRSLTVGTYRGNNVIYTFNIPASAFVVGQNTLSITAISGSGSSGFLSAGYSYDAVELDIPGPGAYWTGALGAGWNAVTTPDTNFNTDAASGINLQQLPGNQTDVFFAAQGATNLATTLNQPFDIKSLTTLGGTGAVSVGGTSQLTLQSGGLTAQNGSGGLTVSAPVALGQNQLWNGASFITASGAISGAATLSTAGSVTLGGANSYSGGTVITSGTTHAGSNSALGSGALTVQGGSLNLNGKTLSVGALSGAAGATITNAATTPATLVTNSGPNDTAFAGNLSDGAAASALTKTGVGTLTLGGQNAYSGLTSVQAGALSIPGGTLGFAVPNTSTSHLEIAPANGSSAAVAIGAGATVSAARVIVGGNVANTLGGSATLTQSGGVLNSSQWLTVGSQGSGTSIFNLQGGTVNVNSAGATQMEIATFAGAAGTVNIDGGQINLLNGANLALGVIGGGSGSAAVNQNGGGVTFFSDAGATPGGSGGLRLGLGTGRTGTYTYNLNGGTLTVPVITRTSGTAILNFGGGTLRPTGNSASFLTGLSSANVKSGGALIDTGGFAVTVAQPLLADTTSAGGGLTKSGAGTLTLAGSNTYVGATTVKAGTLALGAANRIADASGLVLSGGTLATGGFSETLGTLSAPGDATLDLGVGASVLRFSGLGAGGGLIQVLAYSGSANGGGTDQLYIGQNQGLSAAQLGQIRFINPGTLTGTFAAQQLLNGEVVPSIPAVASSGAVISEFRFRGAGGSADEYVEILNAGGAPLNISGWSLKTNSGTLAAPVFETSTVAANTFIPVRGHFLFIGSGYSLSGYGAGDAALAGDAADDSGVALLNAAGATVDAVGFAGSVAALREGAGLASAPTASGQFAWMRDFIVSQSKNTDDSSQDFVFVSPAGANVAGTSGDVASQLGAPSPEGLSSPAYANNLVGTALLDPSVGSAVAPNRARIAGGGTLGTLIVRRTIKNNSGRTLTRVRLGVTSITGLNSALQPGQTRSSQADVRLVSAPDETVILADGSTLVAVSGTSLEAGGTNQAAQTLGGGLGSSVNFITFGLGTPLLPGETRAYNFRLQIERGGNYYIALNILALPVP